MPAGTVERLGREWRGFGEQGYAVLERFLDPALVAGLRREADIALEAPRMSGCERPNNRLAPLRWSDPSVGLILGGAERRQAVARATRGDDLRWISGYVSVKGPGTAALSWHQDWWCWDHPVSLRREPVQVALLCYLCDTDERNGALRVMPCSHHGSVPLHATLADLPSQEAELPLGHAAMGDQPGQLTIRARAGDAVVLDYRLLHGTHPNESAERRDCVLLSFTPSWRGLPADIRAHLIQHLALPTDAERPTVPAWTTDLLPSFSGTRADLELNRVAPSCFAAAQG
jgi:phytanoyl-CoA dioxygenase PhyH